ncbi:MAG: ATP-grasp domain-containing protein [Candidatus Omnitrophica bacterium]|nr:ATP-grasp domain-containing protein [Candidatus Omnitrophota bacterium]
MEIGIAYNLKDELSPETIIDSESCEEFDTAETVAAICNVLEKHGYETVKLGGDMKILDRLKEHRVDFVFNIAEGYKGRNRESQIPSILEMLNIPYSGSDPLTLGLTLDKTLTKKIAFSAGVPYPRYKVAKDIKDILNADEYLRYPLITKPAWEGSSKGIYDSSKVYDRSELEKSAGHLFEKYYDQPVLIEEYIEGREVTVGIIGNYPPRVMGMMEIVNKKRPGNDMFYSLETKRDWEDLVDYISPPDIGRLVENNIKHYALTAFKEFGCRDYARIDFKVSKDEKIFMLEINPLPGLSPDYADLVIMARKQNIKYEDLILSLLNSALSRYDITKDRIENEKI